MDARGAWARSQACPCSRAAYGCSSAPPRGHSYNTDADSVGAVLCANAKKLNVRAARSAPPPPAGSFPLIATAAKCAAAAAAAAARRCDACR